MVKPLSAALGLRLSVILAAGSLAMGRAEMTITKLERARQAFTTQIYEDAVDKGYEFPRHEEIDALQDAIKAEIAAKKLKLAIEEYRNTINSLDHFGTIPSTSEELCKIIFDYDIDEVGHKATDVLRAAVEE